MRSRLITNCGGSWPGEEQGLFSYSRAVTPEPGAPGGLVVRVTSGGRLEWVAPQASTDHDSAADSSPQTPESARGAEVISARERALVTANRERIAELRARAYPSPDLGDIITDIMRRSHPPTVSLGVNPP